jgi:signal transduction histidine kinase
MILPVRRYVAAVAVMVGLLSIGLTLSIRLTGRQLSERDGWWNLAELSVLLLLIASSARVARPRWAAVACCIACIAASVWLLRFGPLQDPWILFVPVTGVAVAVGVYLRTLDDRRVRAVSAAQRAQRLDLARDLHDYVAHDVSEMVALAQAGQVLTMNGSQQVRDLLVRIERAGIAGLESMDRTVRMLHDQMAVAPPPSVADLPDLAERFQVAGSAAVHLKVDDGVPRDVGPTIYRIVNEALANVRRHAPSATQVDVCVRDEGDRITVSVNDDARIHPVLTTRRGGFGLAGLATRAEALGGTLSAGPGETQGWTLSVVLPRKAIR